MVKLVPRRSSTVPAQPHLEKMLEKRDSYSYVNLIRKKEWIKVMTKVTRRQFPEESACDILYTACKSNPPLRFIDTLIDLYPSSIVENANMPKNRTALHVACEHGASEYVVDYLVSKNEELAKLRDNEGKLPLHLACQSFIERCDQDMSIDEKYDSLRETTLILLECYPDAVTFEDNDGMCPIEYAIISDARNDIIELLRRASEIQRKNKQPRK